MDSFHIWYKWSLAWEGVSYVTTFDLDLYLQGHLTLFLLGIQHDSIVWVIMRRRGVSSERRRSSCSSYNFHLRTPITNWDLQTRTHNCDKNLKKSLIKIANILRRNTNVCPTVTSVRLTIPLPGKLNASSMNQDIPISRHLNICPDSSYGMSYLEDGVCSTIVCRICRFRPSMVWNDAPGKKSIWIIFK